MIKQQEQWHSQHTQPLTSSRTPDKTGHSHSLWNIGTMCVPANSSSYVVPASHLLMIKKGRSGACQYFAIISLF